MDHFRVENLSISFGGLKAVSNVSFNVEKNSIFSIIGPNGSGKTTIFNLISCIYKADQGRVVLDGEDILGHYPDWVARKGIARTFQNIELFSNATVMDNLMLGRHVHMKTGIFSGAFMWGRRSRAAREEIRHRGIVEGIVDFLDLQSVRDQFVANLPYGKRKLVELGRALALEPKILLLDEPSAGMNTEEKEDLNIWVKDIREDYKVTILLIEHDMNMIMGISDRVFAINHGEKIIEGVPQEVQSHPEVIKAYLGEEAPMLKVKNIETWYDLIRALHGISFEVNKGDIVALLGSNGAGKTTTLKTIMRLLYDLKEEQPEKGTIEFLGQRIERMDTDQIVRLGISYVPEGREVFPELTVVENILMGAYTRRDKKGIKDDMEKIFDYFPILKQRREQEAGYMSGGEQQMLAIGRALMSRPKLLMLDEPSLGLSPLLTKEIFTIIRDINQKDGVTILLVEQNVNMALKYANFAFLMENGRIVRAEKPEVLREDPDVKEFYLGITTEKSVKGYKRYRRKVRFR